MGTYTHGESTTEVIEDDPRTGIASVIHCVSAVGVDLWERRASSCARRGIRRTVANLAEGLSISDVGDVGICQSFIPAGGEKKAVAWRSRRRSFASRGDSLHEIAPSWGNDLNRRELGQIPR